GSSFREAVWIIIVADAIMSLDNVLAVAAAAHGDLFLVVFGIGLSLPIVVWGSGLLAVLMNRFAWIIWIGGGILGYVASEMILSDRSLARVIEHVAPGRALLPFLPAVGIVALGWWFSAKNGRKGVPGRAWFSILSGVAQDLRSYLDLVKRRKPGDFEIVAREVDPAYEITALVVKLEREARRRPVLLFEKVKGTRFPVLTNLHASRARLAAAMSAPPEHTLRTYLSAMEKPVPPKVVTGGPVQEVVLTGDSVNLYDLPQIVHHEGDAGPYVTAAISFAKDPTADIWNCAYNRLQIKTRDTTSIHLTTGKHLWEFHRIAEARGEPLPVALAIGVHPAIALGALAIGSIDEDERAIMGALLGEPLELVRCETSDVLVPAHAEMVLEGEILPGTRIPEGPFGEFTGYSLGERPREVVRVRAITHRRDAIFQDI